jgi:hypothetical protein
MRPLLVLIFATVLVAWAPGVAWAPVMQTPTHVPAPGSSDCPGCDLLGYSNIQGGTADEPNLDIGAGSTDNPGAIVLNYDVGRTTAVYDGQKHLLATFGPQGIVFYRHPKVERPPAAGVASRR